MNQDIAMAAAYRPEDGLRMRTNEILHDFDFDLRDSRRAHPVNPAEPTAGGYVTEFHQSSRARGFAIAVARVVARLHQAGVR